MSGIMDATERTIHRAGLLGFQNSVGCTLSQFLWLPNKYLQSTAMRYNKSSFRQKSDVCIASRIAPVLSNLFLSDVDAQIDHNLQASGFL